MHLSPWVQDRLAQLDRLSPSSQVPVEELLMFNKALRIAAGMEADEYAKSASNIGYGLQGTAFDSNTVGSTYAPIATQSIQPMVDNLTFTADDLMFMRMLTTAGATTTVHEYVQRESYGEEDLSIWASEGGTANVSKSKFRRRTVNMKYMMEVREYTDVANNVAYLGVAGSARAIELQDGALNFAKKIENQTFWGDSALNALAHDGLFPSLAARASGLIVDYRGALPTPQEINGYGSVIAAPPYHSKVTQVLCSPRVKTAYENQAIPYTRTDGFQGSGRNLDYTIDAIRFSAGERKVPLVAIPYLDHKQHPWVRAVGSAPPAALTGGLEPTITAVNVGAGGTNQWTTTETGGNWDYYYIVEAHGDGGGNISAILGPYTPASSAYEPRVDIADSGEDLEGDNGIRYYSIYRARVAKGATAPTDPDVFWWVGDHAKNKVNSGATRFYDTNEWLPETSQMLICEISPRVMQWTSLLDMYMRPLFRSMTTTNPFALIKYGAFTLKMENKIIWLKNVKVSA